MLLIQNGRVLDPWTGTDAQLDVLIGNDGVIAKIAEKIDAPADCKIFDAAGLTVSPGFVDGHVHFRDPGQTQKEDVLTGAAAAAAGRAPPSHSPHGTVYLCAGGGARGHSGSAWHSPLSLGFVGTANLRHCKSVLIIAQTFYK